MFARMTTSQTDPAKLDAMIKAIGAASEQLKKISGVVTAYTSWDANGSACTFAVYESQEAAKAATDQVRAIWASLAGMLTAAPVSREYENVLDLMA
ncbi:MAG: hypothetical protein ABJA49_18295 [Betaproteobacteria bacterium]